MFCARCGASHPDDGKFCPGCGAPLEKSAWISAAVPQVSSPGQPSPPPPTSGKAIASLVCGIFFLLFPAAVAAVILGHLSMSEISKAAGRLKGRGLATAGLVLGYLGVAGLIPLILIIAAIAVPNLLRARMSANESSALVSLRAIDTAATQYSSDYSNGFPPSMSVLGGAGNGEPSCDQSQLIDNALALGQKDGYEFSYVPSAPLSAEAKGRGCASSGVATFEVHADPVARGTTGLRSFFTDQTGVIRYDRKGPATADSAPLE
jgi:type IV pilus assembly protein PilA